MLQDSGIPMFGKTGTALSNEERIAIAKRKGVCVRCGTKTHTGNILRRIPLNNNDVYQGVCIRCNPDSVPANVYSEWRARNVRSAPSNAAARFRGTARAVQYASSNRPGQTASSAGSGSSAAAAPNTRWTPPPTSNVITAEVTPIATRKVASHSDGYARSTSDGAGNLGSSGHNQNSHSHLGQNSYRPHSTGAIVSSGRQVPDATSNSVPKSAPQLQPASRISQSQSTIDAEEYKSTSDEDSWELVKALKASRDNPTLLKQKLHRFRNLSEDQAGALYEIKDIMDLYRNDPRVMMVATGAVWGIAAHSDDKKAEAAETGTADVIIDALRNGSTKDDSDTVQWALGCLSCLAQAEENKPFIAAKGGIEAMVNAFRLHQMSPGVFEWACRALHTMVFRYDGAGGSGDVCERNIVTIEEANGIQVVVSAMKIHIPESIAQWWAVKLLWRLQDRSDPSAIERTIKRMIDEDLISVCVKLLKARSTSPELFQQVAELVCTLAYYGGSSRGAAECLSSCLRVMADSAENASMQASCSKLLAVIARSGNESKREISDAHALHSLLGSLQSFPENIELMQAGMTLLWTLTADPTSFDISLLPTIKQLVETCLAFHPDTSVLHIAISGFVANITLAPQISKAVDIPVEALVSLLASNDGEVSEQAGRAISNACSRFPDAADRLMDSALSDRLIEGLCNSSPSVQSSCAGALTSIAIQSEEKRNKIFSSGGIGTACAALLTTSSEKTAESVLELISSLVNSNTKKVMQIPNEIIQAILASMRSFSSARKVACTTIRNSMLVTVPGFSVNVDGIVDALTDILDAPSSNVELVIEACGAVWAFIAKQPSQNTSQLSQLFRSVLGIMGRNKGDGAPFHSAILTAAAGALASIMQAIRENPVHIPDNDIDLIISILDLVIECDVENTELMESMLDVVLSLSFLAKEVLIQFGVIVVVIDCMVEHEQHEMIQQKGCSILALLASTENLQVNLSIAETDGIDMIVSALAVFSENSEIQIDACRALSHLSIDHESRMLISSQGGLILLVNAMNRFRDDVDLLEAACSALLNLSSDAEEQVLAGSNVVDTVINVMRYQVNSAKLQEKGLGVLQNVSMRSKEAKRAIAEAGGIEAVTFTIKEFMGSPYVLERAFTTMWSLAVLEENQGLIADAGGIGLVVNGMMANITYEKVQKQACGCLCTLSSNSRNKTLIRDVGGVDSIVYAMWAHYNSDNLQIEACRALSSLAVNVQTNEVMIATDGEISAIISAMRRFPNSERLQEHACVALRNFLLSADNAALVRNMRDQVVKLMNHAASRFPDRCAERAKQVLASIS